MRRAEADVELLAFLLEAHTHAMAVALTRTLGAGQAFLIREYASALQRLLKQAGAGEAPATVREYAELLRRKRLAKAVRVESLPEGKVKFVVEGCALAPTVHPLLGLNGQLMCPMALVAMVALATERGYAGGDDIFNFVKFDKRLSVFKPDGSETVFRLV